MRIESLFLYKNKQAKGKEATMSGVFKAPDYSKTEPIPELRERIQREANKRS
jgi:hypothetical protein